ncbi:hypothetical protein QJT78_52040, partial [Bradyrhizobium sp. Mp27]
MPCVEPAAGADLGLLGDCLLTRQAGHLDRRDAARFDQGRGPLHSGRRLFPSRGRGLDRRLDFGDARLELKDAAIAELARLAGEVLLRGLGGCQLSGKARALVLLPRHLPPKIVEPHAIATRVDDMKDRVALMDHAELRRALR